MDQSQFPTVESQHRMVDPAKYEAMPRRQRRRVAHRVGIMQAPGSARVRSGVRTGTTQHFKFWMADLRMRSVLQKTSLRELAYHTVTPSLVKSAFALAFNAGIRNVYALARADIARLLSIDGIGPKKLEAVEKYLLDHNVKPHWTVMETADATLVLETKG